MIDIAKEFSPYPSGRVPSDGTFNGEAFREEILLPALKKVMEDDNDRFLEIDIDGVRTFGSSFLEEAFGGVARDKSVDAKAALSVVRIKCTKDHLAIYKDAILALISETVNGGRRTSFI